jgi:hypothetical protein
MRDMWRGLLKKGAEKGFGFLSDFLGDALLMRLAKVQQGIEADGLLMLPPEAKGKLMQ